MEKGCLPFLHPCFAAPGQELPCHFPLRGSYPICVTPLSTDPHGHSVSYLQVYTNLNASTHSSCSHTFLRPGAANSPAPHVPSACLGLIKPEIRRVQMEPHHVILPVSAGLKFLWATFNQALVLQKTGCHLPDPGPQHNVCPAQSITHHVLPLRQDLEEGVMPLQDVGI